MNTHFTVTCLKGTPQEAAYTIDLGQDILEGLSDSIIREKAAQSLVINVQGGLRKKESVDAIEEHLRKTYPEATVEVGVVREESASSVVRKLEKILGKDELRRLLDERLAEAQ